MRLYALTATAMLAGCAGGTVLEQPSTGASHLSAAPGVLLRISPMHSERVTNIVKSKAADVFLSGGWYQVDFNCSYLERGDSWVLSITEYTTSRNLRIVPGYDYTLECDPKVTDVLRVKKLRAGT